MIKLDFAVVGTQKAGSTFILKNLKDHPQIYMPDGEVPYFENPDFFGEQKLDFYFKKKSYTLELLGIKRPNYFEKKEVPARLFANNSKIKLIVFLRNPVERAISAYFHGMKMGFLPILPINEGLSKILEGDEGFQKTYPYCKELINHGYYSQHLQKYLKYFKKENIYIGFMEEIKNKPLETIQNLYNFLGVDKDFVPAYLNEKPMASIYSSVRLKYRQLITFLTFSYSDDKKRMHKKSGVLFYILRKLLFGIDRLILQNMLVEKKPKINDFLKEKMLNIYLFDIKNLETILNKKLDFWCKN